MYLLERIKTSNLRGDVSTFKALTLIKIGEKDADEKILKLLNEGMEHKNPLSFAMLYNIYNEGLMSIEKSSKKANKIRDAYIFDYNLGIFPAGFEKVIILIDKIFHNWE
ncbi:hypothetical protein [Enterovibrio nigricans]|uniref:Uncharacterized protein n=1 Tax=Enterovibrio nigricans DSM 22720 TaxID=1121868 RepID=A0A1T4U4N0_9GAMM|nr:hypothetical protein [Enterovibrio nigricans]PKF50530.1 hypothetical protein AT251_10670 [Enterovibrio nigricans]SKA47712.1 hypothetical protein SAMN02745132_00745 [Enterovibrio nigricans DSM 22720]